MTIWSVFQNPVTNAFSQNLSTPKLVAIYVASLLVYVAGIYGFRNNYAAIVCARINVSSKGLPKNVCNSPLTLCGFNGYHLQKEKD